MKQSTNSGDGLRNSSKKTKLNGSEDIEQDESMHSNSTDESTMIGWEDEEDALFTESFEEESEEDQPDYKDRSKND